MNFRKEYTVKTAVTGGFYFEGVWQSGSNSTVKTIEASVQPAGSSDYDKMELRSDGARVERMVCIYTDANLKQKGSGDDTAEGDILLYDDCEFVIRDKSPHQCGIISHYRYLAVKT